MIFVFERQNIHTSYASIEADSLEEAIEKLDGRMKSGCFYSVQGKGISYYDIK